ncbi:GAF domain-containing protein [Saxibacter everestensis]|uniref:GAF domain-containing protein n=1 Tax=Saxibacter everestensis TaxID=2909229 RepID=A0ABY8QQU0_9MICO|nr:GAF domain-containing protein [Brevibacteriaceae bacterium ZFBP1038]
MSEEFASLEDVHRAVAEHIGVKLFTVLGFADQGRTMCRIYSTHPVAYPVGGTKDTSQDVAAEWLALAIEEQKPYFGQGPAEVERIFKDAEVIRSLGCGTIINAPVVKDGVTIGALNILDAEGAYDQESVGDAVDIAGRSAGAVSTALRRTLNH